jgi:hypothetical protein
MSSAVMGGVRGVVMTARMGMAAAVMPSTAMSSSTMAATPSAMSSTAVSPCHRGRKREDAKQGRGPDESPDHRGAPHSQVSIERSE